MGCPPQATQGRLGLRPPRTDWRLTTLMRPRKLRGDDKADEADEAEETKRRVTKGVGWGWGAD